MGPLSTDCADSAGSVVPPIASNIADITGYSCVSMLRAAPRAHAVGVAARQEPETVALDLVNPLGPYRRLLCGAWRKGRDARSAGISARYNESWEPYSGSSRHDPGGSTKRTSMEVV
jgi:hypothetical protein